jgi:hypothetical protein
LQHAIFGDAVATLVEVLGFRLNGRYSRNFFVRHETSECIQRFSGDNFLMIAVPLLIDLLI